MQTEWIRINGNLWADLMDAAKRRQEKPQALARRAIATYLQQLSDEELLERSSREARKSGVSIAAAESAIKERRKAQ